MPFPGVPGKFGLPSTRPPGLLLDALRQPGRAPGRAPGSVVHACAGRRARAAYTGALSLAQPTCEGIS